MISEIGKQFGSHFYVMRREADLDRAMDDARARAVGLCQIDDDGHSGIAGWDRSSCSIVVEFRGVQHRIGMVGHDEVVYKFYAWVEKADDDDDDWGEDDRSTAENEQQDCVIYTVDILIPKDKKVDNIIDHIHGCYTADCNVTGTKEVAVDVDYKWDCSFFHKQ